MQSCGSLEVSHGKIRVRRIGSYVIGSGNEKDTGALSSTGTITISGGTVYATSQGSGQAWQGVIGGGNGLTVNITGGEIHASFASNHSVVYDKTVFTLAPHMMVLMGNDASTAQRQDANGRYTALLDNDMKATYAIIKPCDHLVKSVSHFDDTNHYYKCSYCDTSADQNGEGHTFNSSGICEVCGKGREWILYDVQDNSTALEEYNGKPAAKVTLSGRTLYRDGSWNTLCLPFDVEIESSTLQGATAMHLNNATLDNEGTLTLDFKEVASYTSGGSTHTFLQAGIPYIIKWTTTGDPIVSPEFTSCSFASTQPFDITFDGVLSFRGTYNPVSIGSEGDNTKLYLGADNTLYYPSAAMSIGSFRAYFQLADGITAGDPNDPTASIKACVLNFDDEVATGITTTDFTNLTNSSEAWFSIDGRRLADKPSSKGIYIHNGKKIVIK